MDFPRSRLFYLGYTLLIYKRKKLVLKLTNEKGRKIILFSCLINWVSPSKVSGQDFSQK